MGVIARRSDIEVICEATGALPITGPELLSEADIKITLTKIPNVKRVKEQEYGEKKVIVFEGCSNTVILRAPSSTTLAEAERAFHDAMCVVMNLVREPTVVLGGGVVEGVLSVFIERESDKEKNSVSFIMKAYASALEEIPGILAENSGMDPLKSVIEMKERVEQGFFTFGIDVTRNKIGNLNDFVVCEAMINKQAQIMMATEAAISILKIDEILYIGRL